MGARRRISYKFGNRPQTSKWVFGREVAHLLGRLRENCLRAQSCPYHVYGFSRQRNPYTRYDLETKSSAPAQKMIQHQLLGGRGRAQLKIGTYLL